MQTPFLVLICLGGSHKVFVGKELWVQLICFVSQWWDPALFFTQGDMFFGLVCPYSNVYI